MKTKPGYKLLSVAGEHMVVPLEIQNTDFHAIITLNKTGAFLWRLLQKECTEEREFMKQCLLVMLYIRRVYRVLTGKRAKMNYFKVYKDSYQRKELYQQLHIFER